ncbi:MAG: hypothetical protein LUD50_05020 [Clostridia bacterium]|nr:hypothetical protein [Clostridia bacterium]
MEYEIINILDLIRDMGRPFTEKTLKKFSCPKNPDVEAFIRNKAIGFAKTRTAITYLVVGTKKPSSNKASTEVPVEETSTEKPSTEEKVSKFTLGYFTLANKPIAKPIEAFNEETERTLSRFSYDIEGSTTKVMASLLIAQFAKNDALPDDVKAEFKGSDLMNLALKQVRNLHSKMGGCTVYLECTDTPFLIDFYKKQGFFRAGERQTEDSYLLRFMTVLQKHNNN